MHTRQPELQCHWDVHLDDDHYATVFIWENVNALRRALGKGYKDTWGAARTGYYFIRVDDNKKFIPKKFSEVHLVTGHYDVETVAHELQHVVNYWAMAMEWSLDWDEESFASTAGRLHREFWEGHHENFV